MKKSLLLFVLFFIVALVTTKSLRGQDDSSEFSKLTYEVRADKASYLPFEPISISFKVSNNTGNPVLARSPNFLLHSSAEVRTPAGKVIRVSSLSLGTGGSANMPNSKTYLEPGKSYEEVGVPAVDPEIFADPGLYQVQFSLKGLTSNLVTIDVSRPTGSDARAFEFLNTHGKDIWFGRLLQDTDGIDLLKLFVERFADTTYGEYGITLLGKYYLNFERNSVKAKAEFEKIKASGNILVAREAKKGLDLIQATISTHP